MNDVTVDPVFSAWLSAGILLVVVVCILLTEWKRTTAYRVPRLIAGLMILLALAMLLLRPTFGVPQSEAFALLTEGFETASVDSLRDRVPGLELLSMPDAKPYQGATHLRSVNDLSSYADKISVIIGYGLPPSALELVRSRFSFVPADHPDGIVQLFLPQASRPNKNTAVQGVVNLIRDTKIILAGPGGAEDSITLPGTGFRRFALHFTPRQPGRFLYSLTVGDREPEVFPVVVQEEKKLNILMLQYYPSFESRQLKNYLARYHKLLVRYQPTRNRFRYEYINRNEEKIDRLRGNSLQRFDLVIADADVIQAFSPSERNALHEAVMSGLGLIILFNESPVALKKSELLPFAFSAVQSDTVRLTIGKGYSAVLPAWPASPRSEFPVTPVTRSGSRILSGYCHSGFGKIGFQLLHQTHQLALRGDSATYARVWADLVTGIASAEKEKISIATPSFPVFPGEPLAIRISSPGFVPSVQFKNTTLPLMEDVLLDDIWQTKLWLDSSGWHMLDIKDDSTQVPVYVCKPGTWKSLWASEKMQASAASGAVAIPPERSRRKEVPAWLIFTIFILGAAWLWIEPKL